MTRIVILAGALLLSGCTGGMFGGAAAVVASSLSVTTLSELSAAACGAQAAANLAGRVAEARGDTVWAERFAEAAKIAGLGCKW